MERSILRENNNSFDLQQSPQKSQVNSSLLETEEKPGENLHETTKENYNPKSLSEIASDLKAKLPPPQPFENNVSSTPKITVNREQSTEEFELDTTIDITPKYSRGSLKEASKDFSLSFLTDGLNKLGLDSLDNRSERSIDARSNATFSDDDEQFLECQSFGNISSRGSDNATNVHESSSDSSANKTINADSGHGNDTITVEGEADIKEVEAAHDASSDHKVSEVKDDNLNCTVTLPINQTFEGANDTNKTEIFPNDNNETFEVDALKAEGIEENFEADRGDEKLKESFVVAQELKEKSPEIASQPQEIATHELYQNIDTYIPHVNTSLHEPQAEPQSEVASPPTAPQLDSPIQETTQSPMKETRQSPVPINPFENEHHQAFESHFNSQPIESIFVEKMETSFEVEFKVPSLPVFKPNNVPAKDDEFKSGSSYSFGESDLDYLQTFGKGDTRKSQFQRDSLLLKFDPLLAHLTAQNLRLSATKEEDDFVADFELKLPKQEEESSADNSQDSLHEQSRQLLSIEDESMSVDIMKDISVDNKTTESNHIQCDETKLSSHYEEVYSVKMSELENKLKKEAEMREEALLKRISEKDKQITKMTGVVEAYEKAISELIAEKEQIAQAYDKKCADLKNDSELNANHLSSLEATFSDLHAKYERTKQIAMELKEREEMILQDRKTLTENLKMQEARYDKMKSHAMSQLEIANNTLAEMNRTHQAEATKLKAHLKKEEISRASVNEQLIQKSKENSELVKICDELINGTSSS